MRKPKRFCRICGAPEKITDLGYRYSNLTPYSQICTDCVNKHIMKQDKPTKKGQRHGTLD